MLKEVLAAVFMSNCAAKNDRNKWLNDLMKEMPIDSFGKCKRNKFPAQKGCNQTHYDAKLCVIKQYKFYLAFENSNDESYVTEKYWQALKAGSVPIYLGAPNIEKFDPLYNENDSNFKSKSFIKVSDFKNAKDLASYLTKVANDENLYNSFLAWKYLQPSQYFEHLATQSIDHSETVCKICQTVKNLKSNKTST